MKEVRFENKCENQGIDIQRRKKWKTEALVALTRMSVWKVLWSCEGGCSGISRCLHPMPFVGEHSARDEREVPWRYSTLHRMCDISFKTIVCRRGQKFCGRTRRYEPQGNVKAPQREISALMIDSSFSRRVYKHNMRLVRNHGKGQRAHPRHWVWKFFLLF